MYARVALDKGVFVRVLDKERRKAKAATGEQDARNPPVRFGGGGVVRLSLPYRRRATPVGCKVLWRFPHKCNSRLFLSKNRAARSDSVFRLALGENRSIRENPTGALVDYFFVTVQGG